MPTFTPAQTAQHSGFTIETLRYYEQVGLLRNIRRNSSGHRVFDRSDLDWLAVLRCLRDTGMPIATMQQYADQALTDTPDTIPARLALLETHERSVAANIALLQQQRRHLKEKIAHYREQLDPGR